MGSPFNIIFYHTDSTEAVQFAHECFLLVDSLNNIFSDYSSSSEVGRLAQQIATREYRVSNELFEIILKSKSAWQKSDKTFDITIGTLSQLWRKARSEKRFPSTAEVKKAKHTTGFNNLVINISAKTISFKRYGMQLDFGGIVKGYAAQKVVNHLKNKNITIALADAGGDIAMSDAPPGKNGWSIGINLPEQENELWNRKLELKNFSVATSGDVYRFTLYNGKKYSHIIDPRTGYGVTTQRNVTVIAKDGATADWLATACSILSIEKALKLARKENAALLITNLKDEKIIIHKTENFDSYFQKKDP
ncbi:MAG: FAD:protein FMN transferase [Bacteroidota bacterium]|nr:FAD:protein FMN transferase [Bacteroidota bacterium]